MKVINLDLGFLTQETGPIFGAECEDLDFTLLQWSSGDGVQEHLNDELDVLMIVLAGQGEVTVDGVCYALESGRALLIPKNTRRRVLSSSDGFRYLNVHKRRKRLMPGPLDRRPSSQ
jgi:quercetin dioxygenase-like cupin family protein